MSIVLKILIPFALISLALAVLSRNKANRQKIEDTVEKADDWWTEHVSG